MFCYLKFILKGKYAIGVTTDYH